MSSRLTKRQVHEEWSFHDYFCTAGDKNGNVASSWGGLSFAPARSGVAQSASKVWPRSSPIMQPPVHGVTHHRGLGSSRRRFCMTDANDNVRGAGAYERARTVCIRLLNCEPDRGGTVMVLGSTSLEVTTSRVYRCGTGASIRSVIVVFWPCGIALVSGRGSNTRFPRCARPPPAQQHLQQPAPLVVSSTNSLHFNREPEALQVRRPHVVSLPPDRHLDGWDSFSFDCCPLCSLAGPYASLWSLLSPPLPLSASCPCPLLRLLGEAS
jgi:hypothetical protein